MPRGLATGRGQGSPQREPHPRLLAHNPPQLEIRQRREHFAGIPAPRGDEGVDVPKLRTHRVPERPLDGIEVRRRRPLIIDLTLPTSLFPAPASPRGNPISSRMSPAVSAGLAPCWMSLLQPTEVRLVIGPGTASTVRPCSRA